MIVYMYSNGVVVAPETATLSVAAPRLLSSNEGEGQTGLILVLALLVRITDTTHFFGLQEHDLRDPLAGVDLRGQGRRVRNLDRDPPAPFGFQGRHVHDDSASRVGRFPHADAQD